MKKVPKIFAFDRCEIFMHGVLPLVRTGDATLAQRRSGLHPRSKKPESHPFLQIGRYSPSIVAKSSCMASSLLCEPVMPHSRSADQVCILAQRSQSHIRFLVRNKTAAPANGFANFFQKKNRTLHHTAPEHNGIGREERDQICQAKS